MPSRTEPFRAGAPAATELSAGIVVVDPRTRHVLLLHQRDEDRWCLPKGHVDPGESVEVAAIRELAEEAGIQLTGVGAEISEVHYRFFDPRKGVNVLKTTVYFLANAPEQPAQLEPGFDRYGWYDLGAAEEMVPFDADRETIVAAARRSGP